MLLVLVASRGINGLASVNPLIALVAGALTSAAAIAAYVWLTRRVEGREADEVSLRNMWPGLFRGILLGAGLFTATILLIGMFGGWASVSWHSFGAFLVTLGLMASVAVSEELLFRGVVYRILEERAGTVIAVLASSLFFGAMHLVNEHATPWGAVAIALEGGTLTAACFLLTRSLWLPIGLHFAWNATQSGVFGAPVSGAESGDSGLLHLALHTSKTALTGGTFGPEASLIAMLVCTVPAILLLRRAHRAGRFRTGTLTGRLRARPE
ncbi:CPBP family intramembrane glutamic endopeptidase [Catenuloplanes atrovinosus]|uniref:Membrane protease YdiL (CAAX protease family) n=1 Tax=Catenuloplanes atrovinosus TaxID=137266 RepID=A0AAE3YTN8_9ACTN|nr:CPBP family intramembrane glutamic endopeptidase [Catenuloplanes atrovinosus]MDR7279728.1 membrane protease YdiL (CAAX protease family) [Catenuloplanes atrovinosus]